MREQTRSNPFVSLFYALFPLLVGAGVLFVLVIIGGRALQGYEMRQEAKAMEQRVDELRRENRRLAQGLEYYRSDQYIEKVAREELGLVRPGDVSVVMASQGDGQVLPLKGSPTPTPVAVGSGKETATWQKWLAIFVDTEQ